MTSSCQSRSVHGIDFSGAADAGKKIWVATGVFDGKTLQIEECRRAEALPASARKRDQCITALGDFITGESQGIFGFDFPFGLPLDVIKKEGWNSWEDFILGFPQRYDGPMELRRICSAATGGRELKRVTDIESRAPFSPYNLRVYRQTYYGIRDVLHPLVRGNLACVLPMQDMRANKPWILEVCPSSTLKREELYRSYKGRTPMHRASREHVLENLELEGTLSVPRRIRTEIIDDREGDALDSIIAAFATFRAIREPASLFHEADGIYALEGYIYV